MMTTQVCTICNTEKTLDQFQADAKYRLGVIKQCKKCRTEQRAVWAAQNKNKVRQNNTTWRGNNRRRYNDLLAERKRIKKSSCPSWLSAIELAQIQEIYDVAAAKTMQTGVLHHVDHIHPLRGDGFNGLHVPWNLQILTKSENCKKSNKLPITEKHLFWGHG